MGYKKCRCVSPTKLDTVGLATATQTSAEPKAQTTVSVCGWKQKMYLEPACVQCKHTRV